MTKNGLALVQRRHLGFKTPSAIAIGCWNHHRLALALLDQALSREDSYP